MKTYRRVWLYSVGVLISVGAVLAALVISLQVLVLVFVVTALLVGVTAWTWIDECGPRAAARAGLAASSALVAGTAYVVASAPAGIVLIALVGVCAPPVVDALARRLQRPPGSEEPAASPCRAQREEMVAAAASGPGPTAVDDEWMDESPAVMDATALCRAWRTSFLALHQPLSAVSKAGVVQRRRELLDELERRNPAGFTAWLCAGAGAAEDPRRYIVH